MKDWYWDNRKPIDTKWIFSDFYGINLRNSRVFFCAENVGVFLLNLLQNLSPSKNRYVHLLRKIVGANVIKASRVILMLVCKDDSIQFFHTSPQHLHPEIRTCIHHKRNPIRLQMNGRTESFVPEVQ